MHGGARNHSSPQTNEFLRKTKEKPPSFISQWRDACKSYLSPGCLQPNRSTEGPAVAQQAMDPAMPGPCRTESQEGGNNRGGGEQKFQHKLVTDFGQGARDRHAAQRCELISPPTTQPSLHPTARTYERSSLISSSPSLTLACRLRPGENMGVSLQHGRVSCATPARQLGRRTVDRSNCDKSFGLLSRRAM